MTKALIVLADGFEESEALVTVSYVRRAGIDLDIVSLDDSCDVTSSHQVHVHADKPWSALDTDSYDLLITPGGIPGATNLAADKRLTQTVKDFYDSSRWLAHICASPLVLHAAGIAHRIEGVCFPGFEEKVGFLRAHDDIVYVDGHVITSRGPLTAPFFAFTIIEQLEGKKVADKIRSDVLFPLVKKEI